MVGGLVVEVMDIGDGGLEEGCWTWWGFRVEMMDVGGKRSLE